MECVSTFLCLVFLLTFISYPPLVHSSTERCGYKQNQTQVTREELERYGNCVPYNSSSTPLGTPCDELFQQGVDYVYMPYTRKGGQLSSYLQFFEKVYITFQLAPDQCKRQAHLALCHFFLPPCGNSTVFKPPTSVCDDICNLLNDLCPAEFKFLVDYFEQRPGLVQAGLSFINCSNTGEYLEPLPYCCSDVDVSIPCTVLDNSGELVSDHGCMSSANSNSDGLVTGVATALVVVIVVVVVLVTAVAYMMKKRKFLQEKQIIEEADSRRRTNGTLEPARYHGDTNLLSPDMAPSPRMARVSSGYIRQLTEEKLLIPGRSITLMDTVGQGEFGVVYRGNLDEWRNTGRELVAVKTLKGVFSVNDLNSMVEESLKMTKFTHPNVMRLIGVCTDMGHSPYIVMPYMAYGSLLSYLKKHRPELTIANDDNYELVNTVQMKLLSMCLQVVKGMAYLASQMFVHRDLAARNCMIDENFVIKVADFGLSEDIYARNYFRQGKQGEDGEASVKLPVRWMAVESLNDGVFSEKTDVWSFGVTYWEVFSLGRTPYPGVDPFTLIKFLNNGGRLDRPANAACSQKIYSTMSDCWVEVPDKRPTFSDLVTTLSTALEDIAGYLDFTPHTQEQQLLHGSGYDHLDPAQASPARSVRPGIVGYDHLNPTIVVTDTSIDDDLEQSMMTTLN